MSFKNGHKREMKGQATLEYFLLAAGILAVVVLTNNTMITSMVSEGHDVVERVASKFDSAASGGGSSGSSSTWEPEPEPSYNGTGYFVY